MTDVYISCASEDAGRMAPVVDGLRAEGWKVWFEPEATPERREHAIDAELGAAGAVVVLWSDNAEGSESVRTEAATGLYRNKLIQVKVGEGTPPRPFNQVEVIDLTAWNGASHDPTWQRVIGAVRLYAGAPGSDRPQVVRKSAAGFASEAAARPGRAPFAREAEQAEAAAPTHVFDAPVEDAPAGAADDAMARAFAEPEEPPVTADVVASEASSSPIADAVSEAERKITGAMEREAHEAPPETHDEPEPARSSLFAEPEDQPVEPTPEPEDAHEPIVFARPEPEPPLEMPKREHAVSIEEPRSLVGGMRGASSTRDYTPDTGRGRAHGVAPVAVVGVLAMVGGGLWFVDPMGWREGGEKAAFAEATAVGGTDPSGMVTTGPSVLAATGELVVDDDAEALWAEVDRADPEALRTFITEHRNTMSGETARAHLRVLDSQAWADAVTADVEAEYESYLARFPAPTGEMAGAATNRLNTLGEERRQAIATIQTQLSELALYEGESSGAADAQSQQAAARFAQRYGGDAPSLGEAAPRDLRRFGDRVLEQVRAEAEASSTQTQVASLSSAIPAPEVESAVRPVAPEAEPTVPAPATAEPVEDAAADAEAAALEESAQLAAWEGATLAGTVESYAVFLRDYPDSPRAGAAQAAIEQLSRPAAYGLDWLSADTRAAVEAARGSQAQAVQRASAARGVAEQADEVATRARSGLEDARTVVAPDGDIYETEVSGNQPNGLGVRTAGDAQSSGDRYRGQLSNGLGQGLGVYDYGDNPNNQAAQALRYEGEHAGDVARGFGVTQWRNGNRFEGQDSGETEQGVMTFANGQRYEGELRNGARHGFGVFWTGDGDVMMAGRWENGDLVEPMSPWTGPDIPALVAAMGPAAVEPEAEPVGPQQPEAEAPATDRAPAATPTAGPEPVRYIDPSIEAYPALQRDGATTADASDLMQRTFADATDAAGADSEDRRWLRSGFGGGRRPERF